MIERRYPIQTVLAERKMFAGGGAVLPQQMMPQQQQPGGILASSGPLLDAVAAGAINPDGDGGASLSDVQGFANGGLSTSQDLPYITRYDFENQTGGPSDRPDSRFLPESGMTTDISAQLPGATDEQLRQFISSVDPITQGYVLSQAQSELDRRNSLGALNTQPVNSLTPSPFFQPDGDESVGGDGGPDFADAVTEGPTSAMTSTGIETDPNFTDYMDEENTAPGPGPSGPSGPNDGEESDSEGPAAADGGYFTSRMYNANSGQSGYPNMTAAEEIENGVQRFDNGGSAITPQAIPVNLNAEDAEAADAALGAMVDFGQVPEATIPKSRITSYEPEAANPGFIESIRNVLGTSGRSSVAGDGSVLKLLGDSLRSEQLMNENDQGEIIRSSIAGPNNLTGDGSVLKAIGDLGYDYNSRLPTPSARTAYDIKRALKQGRVVADRKFTGGPGSSPDNVINPAPTNTVGEFETLPERVGLTPEEAKELNLQGMPTEDLYGFADPGTGSTADGEPVSAEAEVEGELVGGSQIEAQSDADSSETVIENAATIFRNIFPDDETPKSPDKTKSAMAKAVEDFKSAMPEYEGMSESEKGYAIMEAGLRIMAGKSPDALTNIAEGLKGLGPKFAKDAKDKRAWNRQVDLSAAKYGLETVAKDKAIEQADERKLFFFYDQSPGKVTKSTPYGEQVAISRKQLLDRGGKLPPNLVKADLVSKSVVGLSASAKSFKKNILANIKAYNITEAESAKIKVELDKTLKTFRQSEAGINLLGMAKARIAKMNTSDGSSIGSFGAAFKDQLNNLANISGADWGKRFKKGKYTNMKLAKADVNMALQALIKADLGSTQAANSISDKDVKLLADAYVDSGFQKNSKSWDLLGLDTKVLGRKLDGALGVFRSNQKAALGVYDGILERFDTVEGKYATVPKMWRMEVDQGPYRRSSFETRLKNVSPYAQALRGRGEGSGGVVSNTGKILRTIVTPTGDFTLNDKNKFVFKPKQGQ